MRECGVIHRSGRSGGYNEIRSQSDAGSAGLDFSRAKQLVAVAHAQ